MVDFFGNNSETHVKLDIKAIAITKYKSGFQDNFLLNLGSSRFILATTFKWLFGFFKVLVLSSSENVIPIDARIAIFIKF